MTLGAWTCAMCPITGEGLESAMVHYEVHFP